MASEGGDVRLRAAWLGCGALYARRTLCNAAAWTAQQNREYETAFRVQQRDIETALTRESAPAKQRRTSPWTQRRPDQQDVLFDHFWPIKELESGIQFKKGLISGLEQSRDRNESLLEASERELVELQAQHAKLMLKFRPQYHHHLQRHGMNVFKCEVENSEDEDSEVENGEDGGGEDEDGEVEDIKGRKRVKAAGTHSGDRKRSKAKGTGKETKKAGREDGRVECVGVDFWCLNLKNGLEILVEVDYMHARTRTRTHTHTHRTPWARVRWTTSTSQILLSTPFSSRYTNSRPEHTHTHACT